MDVLYELWLHTICKFEPDVAAKMSVLFETKKNTFTSSEVDKKILRDIGVSGEFAKRISQPQYFKEAENIIKYCRDNGIRIITQDSSEYPWQLKHIDVPPRLLFLKGERLCLDNEIAVSVVGCRKPTDQGEAFARKLSRNMAENGITVVSGMAEGIDGQAHSGALDANGKTIAVLAGSVDRIYPKCNERIYRKILNTGGTIISERPPKTPVKRYFYQQRNRIVVGLSQGVVFVEGKEKSGTSISARHALENNRDIFAVPGNPMVWQAELPNRLISEGAIVVNNVDSVTEYYRQLNPDKVIKKKTEEPKTFSEDKLVTEDERIINYIKSNGGVANIEDLANHLKISVNILNGRLTILCIKGKLRQTSGNKYVLNE